MRDPNRIDPLLAKLGEAWKKNPDLRFGQFMSIFFIRCGCERDPFYLEDDAWEAAIEACIRGGNPADAISAYIDSNKQ